METKNLSTFSQKPRYDDMMYHQLVNTISKAQSAGLLNKSFLTGLMRGLSQNQEVTLHKGAPSLDAMLHNSGVVSPYGPTLEHVNKARELFEQHNMGTRTYSDDNPAIRPGVITKTDGFNVDDILYKISKNLSNVTKQLQSEPKNPELIKQYEYASAMLEGAMAQNDLTQQSYDVMSESPNSLMNWYPAIATTLDEQNEPAFKTPKTMAIRPTIEYAQFMRHNVLYASERDLQVFNDYLVEELGLVEGKTYFIKLGNYSNKFNFENCICDDIAQIAKQILIINAQAMDKRAATTIDIVAREFIPNDDLPTIYNGMPLRTEFRAFVNFTTGELASLRYDI